MTSQLQPLQPPQPSRAAPSAHPAVQSQLTVSAAPSSPSAGPALSFEVRAKLAAAPSRSPTPPPVLDLPQPARSRSRTTVPTASARLPAQAAAVVPTPVTPAEIIPEGLPVPILPKLKPTSFTSHRNAANPGLALGLLQEMQGIVSKWHRELHRIVQQIHDLYAAGPLVDGWLESYSQDESLAPNLRHADVDCLADFVEKQWGTTLDTTDAVTFAHPKKLPDAAGYRLCGLKEDGQLWFRHCPAAQVPAVSVAIARHQQLRQLLARKQHLEAQLGQVCDRLIHLHSEIQP